MWVSIYSVGQTHKLEQSWDKIREGNWVLKDHRMGNFPEEKGKRRQHAAPGEEKVVKSCRTSSTGLNHVHLRAMNVTLFGNRIFAYVMKLRRDRVGLKSNIIGVFIRRGKFGHRYTEERRPSCEDGDRDWNYTSTNQGNSDCQQLTEARRGKEGLFPKAFRGLALLTS